MTKRHLLLKATGLWLVILAMAIVNAGIREKLLAPLIGPAVALPVSGALLTVIVLLVAWLTVPLFGTLRERIFLSIGVLWFALTLAFELLLGRLIAGQSWLEIIQVFDVSQGNLFVMALLATLVAPWLMAKRRGLTE